MELLQAIIQRLDHNDVPENRYPDGAGEYWAHCPFPDHPDKHASNFSVSERGYNCFGCGKSGSLRELAEVLGIEIRPRTQGLTLEEYASAKKLPLGFLKSLGCETSSFYKTSCVDMPYKDKSGQIIAVRKRLSMTKGRGKKGDTRFRWGKNSGTHLYGLWRMEEMLTKGWVLIVEGESDCQTAWLYDIPALGVPGVSNWNKAGTPWAGRLQTIDVYVWHEPDPGGDSFIEFLRKDLPHAKVISPEHIKDLSEAHISSADVRTLVEQYKAAAKPINSVRALAESAECLEQFKDWITATLGQHNDRNTKLKIAETLCAWFLKNERLLFDTGRDAERGGQPYMVADDGAIWPLHREQTTTRLALYQAGVNGVEQVYRWIVEALTMETIQHGRRMRLRRWQYTESGQVYVSCGPRECVVVRDGQLVKVANGTDNVWFAGDATYPEWSPAGPIDPLSIAAFRPHIIDAEEVAAYTSEVQETLLSVWLVALLSGLRPMPMLSIVGQRGGGKTTLAKAILRMLMGEAGNVTGLPPKQDDWAALVTNSAITGLDNLDSDAPPWLLDEVASALTGKDIKVRELYTNFTVLSREVTSALMVTTRTATFCRPDINQRLLPILTDEFPDKDRQADTDLMDEVLAHRDGLLSWLALRTQELLDLRSEAPKGLPLRMNDYARLVWADQKTRHTPENAAHMLLALRQAQALAVGEGDPLVEALAVFGYEIATQGLWSGKASTLISQLSAKGASIPYLGGGKAIARSLRENTHTLELMGIHLREHKSGRDTIFDLSFDTRKGDEPMYSPKMFEDQNDVDVDDIPEHWSMNI